MKNLFIYVVSTFIFINTYVIAGVSHLKPSKPCKAEIFVNENGEDVRDIHGELIEKHTEMKEKLAILRADVQNEMRQEKPDWEKINLLGEEIKRIESTHEEKIAECVERIKVLQFKTTNNNKNIREKKG